MYILQINKKYCIKDFNNEVTITDNFDKAAKYETIGSAMKRAAEINNIFDYPVCKIVNI